MYEETKPSELRVYSEAERFEVLADDILMIDFMSPELAQQWIDISEEHGGFAPDPNDNVPSHDIHLKELGLFEETEAFMRSKAARIINSYWEPQSWEGIRKAFTMKYKAGSQTSLPIHVDHSLITGSVKLNDDYEGAVLHWPKQNFSNADVPVGKMILFPGMVTHPHYVDELTRGVNTATIWGSRYPGDTFDPLELRFGRQRPFLQVIQHSDTGCLSDPLKLSPELGRITKNLLAFVCIKEGFRQIQALVPDFLPPLAAQISHGNAAGNLQIHADFTCYQPPSITEQLTAWQLLFFTDIPFGIGWNISGNNFFHREARRWMGGDNNRRSSFGIVIEDNGIARIVYNCLPIL